MNDVLIVGGGVMGCATAWALAREGIACTVLERSVPGAEASSAAAGMLGAQVEARQPGPFLQLCLASRKRFGPWASSLKEQTGIDVEFRPCGIVRAALDERELGGLSTLAEEQRAAGLRAQVVDRQEIKDIESKIGAEVVGGVWFADDARVDPVKLLKALRIAAERAGVTFMSGSMVRRVVIEGTRATGVKLEDGTTMAAGHVVIAAGSWSALVEGARSTENVRPARGQIILLRVPVPIMNGVIFGEAAYLCPRDDGRVLVGSTLEFVGYQRAVTAKAVRDLTAAALALVPALEVAEFDGYWSNFRPYTPDELPLLGPCEVDGLYLATGHYRNGILLAPVTGEIVCRAIQCLPSVVDLAPFSPARMKPLGGDVRT